MQTRQLQQLQLRPPFSTTYVPPPLPPPTLCQTRNGKLVKIFAHFCAGFVELFMCHAPAQCFCKWLGCMLHEVCAVVVVVFVACIGIWCCLLCYWLNCRLFQFVFWHQESSVKTIKIISNKCNNNNNNKGDTDCNWSQLSIHYIGGSNKKTSLLKKVNSGLLLSPKWLLTNIYLYILIYP